DPPEISDISPQTINEGGNFTPVALDSYLSEFDGDNVKWSYSGNTDLTVSIDGSDNAIISTPDENWNGSNTIRFIATDQTTNAYSAYKDVTFTVTPVDDPPFIANAINNVNVIEDAEPVIIDLSSVFSDIDNDDAAISKVIQSNTNTSLVSGSLSGNQLTLDFTPDANGTANITIRAFSNGKSVDDLFSVNVTAVNDPPAFTLSGDIQVKEDFTTTEQVTVTPAPVPGDETGQSVTYSISPASVTLANVAIDINTGTITITSVKGHNGNQEFTVMADDGGTTNNTYTQQFSLTVLPKTEQTITFDPIVDRTYGDASFPIFATSSSGLPVYLEFVSGPAELNSNVITITGAGTVTIRATQEGNQDYYAAPAVEQSFEVYKASQVITFDDIPDMTYGDPPFELTATTNAGLPVTFALISGNATLSGNLLTITGAGEISVRASQTGNENYTKAGEVIRTFTVNKAPQTISFAPLQDMKATDPPLLLSASASSGLPVSFMLVSGPATLSGNILTVNGEGTVTVKAVQEGNNNFLGAPSVTRSFTISSKSGQIITFDPIPDQLYGSEPISLNASSSSGLPVTFTLVSGPASLDGNQLSLNGLGEITIKAAQEGNEFYNPAQDVIQSFNVTKAAQTITFTGIPDKTFGDSPFDLEVGASSGLEVNVTVQSGPAILSGKTVTLTGTGEVVISASQPGNAYFAEATTIERSFIVQKASQLLSVDPVDNKSFGDSSFVINASASSGLPVIIKIIDGPGLLNQDTVSIIGAGTILVEISQAGSENYLPAKSVQLNVVVSKASQTIDFLQPEDKVWGDPALALTATASSGLPVSYQVISGPGLIENNKLSYTGTGTIKLAVSQPGNENYLAAETVYRSFEVTKADQSINFDAPGNMLLDDPPRTLDATATSGLILSYSIVAGPAEINGNILTVSGTGDVIVRASQEGNEHYNPAEPVDRKFTVLSPFTDAAITSILSPDQDQKLKTGSAIHVSVRIKNSGNKTLQNFYVVYNVNNGTLISKELVSAPIRSGDSLTFIFTDTWTPEDAGTTEFCVYLEEVENDDNTSNDSVCETFTTVGIFNPAAYPILSQTVYPNPARDHIIFDMKLKKGSTIITLMDETGKILSTSHFNNNEGAIIKEMNIDSFKQGIYFYRIINEGMIGYGKFIKR
ncbi:MAG TPA: T9SS type A sorting domain-containing protein, partial [Bacteroidales bacterium]|nr:T9SS type A sorting domain-containing protein [Bacteroidales bacterium]